MSKDAALLVLVLVGFFWSYWIRNILFRERKSLKLYGLRPAILNWRCTSLLVKNGFLCKK